MKSKSISECERYGKNPFIEEAVKEVRLVKKYQTLRAKGEGKNQMHQIISANGELMGHSEFIRVIEVDEDQFTKLYTAQIAAFFDLNKQAIRVFGYLAKVLQPNKDFFILYMDECLVATGYKHRKDIYKGLVGLIEAGIIARHNYPNHYYINPRVCFNGSRVTFAKQYIKKQKEDKNQLKLFDFDSQPDVMKQLTQIPPEFDN